MESYSESYRKSGVDITAGYAGVKLMALGALAGCSPRT